MLGPEVMELPGEPGAEPGAEPRRIGRAGLISALIVVALASAGGLAFWLRGDEQPAPRVAPAPTTAASAAPSPLAGEPPVAVTNFTHVETIQWFLEGEDTLVRIELDGTLPPERLVRVRLDDGEPREVIQLLAAEQSYEADLEVGSPGLRHIRTGFHQLADSNEQHIVLDLVSPGCRVVSEEIVDDVLELRVSPPESLGS
jgi:hypothetical protein